MDNNFNQKFLSNNLLNLLKSSEGFDIKIIVGEEPNIKEFKVHSLILLSNYIYTEIFSVENNVSLIDIFISANEIELLELCKQLKKHLFEIESAWKFLKDFISLCQHNDANLYNIAFDLVCKNPKVVFKSKEYLNIKEDHLISKWNQTDFMEFEKTTHNCIPHIRFFQMSLHELHLIKAQYKEILPDLSDEIFHNLDPKHNFLQKKILNSEEIIGGYNPLDWHSIELINNRNKILPSNVYNNYRCKVLKSFIFSLFSFSKGAIPWLSHIYTKNKAIVWCNNKGPCFGLQDL
ncbi:8097_t:CDS:2 [Cetraspora pellucida]|uniref:8097_t:CDS:1 n=1 Tax=Cetraspora pellucida TaxID=1433469 RepID=A0A9N9H1M1_9GLOM|nr:8097_t:CDS:2 [Cetraspora pellucida]